MPLSRRSLLVASAAGAAIPARLRAQTRPVVRIGVLNDMSGPYRDDDGPTGVACATQAVQEFAPAQGSNVEVMFADQQNKPDVAASIGAAVVRPGRRGHDRSTSPPRSCALAVDRSCREKNKVMIATPAPAAPT